MENFNKRYDYTKAINTLDKELICEEERPADVPFEKYKALEKENEVLKDVIVRLTVKITALEKEVHPDVW